VTELGGTKRLRDQIVAWTNEIDAAKWVTDDFLAMPYWSQDLRKKAFKWMLRYPGFTMGLMAANLGECDGAALQEFGGTR
jgi:uncharacterized protein YdiU (UPF0061 family)